MLVSAVEISVYEFSVGVCFLKWGDWRGNYWTNFVLLCWLGG